VGQRADALYKTYLHFYPALAAAGHESDPIVALLRREASMMSFVQQSAAKFVPAGAAAGVVTGPIGMAAALVAIKFGLNSKLKAPFVDKQGNRTVAEALAQSLNATTAEVRKVYQRNLKEGQR
jgi:hypothetical protein